MKEREKGNDFIDKERKEDKTKERKKERQPIWVFLPRV